MSHYYISSHGDEMQRMLLIKKSAISINLFTSELDAKDDLKKKKKKKHY